MCEKHLSNAISLKKKKENILHFNQYSYDSLTNYIQIHNCVYTEFHSINIPVINFEKLVFSLAHILESGKTFSPGISRTSWTWFVLLLFYKLVLPAKNTEYYHNYEK